MVTYDLDYCNAFPTDHLVFFGPPPWSPSLVNCQPPLKTSQILSLLYSKAPMASVTHELDFSETDAERDFGVHDINEDQCL